MAKAEPIVPPVRARVVGGEYKGKTQSLDGLNCEACVFENATLEYAGGAYRLVNASFIGTTRVVLKGAAQNTMTLFALIEAVGRGKPKRPEQPIRTATSKQPVTMDWISPVGSK